MDATVPSPLVAWESVYVIIGSSGAALTGLQFVVIALIADARRQSTSTEIAAFATPTILHFCCALLVSCMMSAPWPGLSGLATALDVCGVAGVAYSLLVISRALRQTTYQLQAEDWVWHATLPVCTYSVLALGGVLLRSHTSTALFAIAVATLLLIFIGVHNAWDTVTYVTLEFPAEGSQHSTTTRSRRRK